MRTLIQLAVLAVSFVVVFGVLRDTLPSPCIAAIFIAGVMAFSWIRQQIEL